MIQPSYFIINNELSLSTEEVEKNEFIVFDGSAWVYSIKNHGMNKLIVCIMNGQLVCGKRNLSWPINKYSP